jgi:hypothetical protein
MTGCCTLIAVGINSTSLGSPEPATISLRFSLQQATICARLGPVALYVVQSVTPEPALASTALEAIKGSARIALQLTSNLPRTHIASIMRHCLPMTPNIGMMGAEDGTRRSLVALKLARQEAQ